VIEELIKLVDSVKSERNTTHTVSIANEYQLNKLQELKRNRTVYLRASRVMSYEEE